MGKKIFSLYNRKFVAQLAGILTAQEIIVALGTLSLGLLGKNLADPKKLFIYFGLFLICSFLPYLFAIAIKKIELQGYFSAYFEFIHLRLLKQKGNPGIWQNQINKDQFLTAIGPDAETYLNAVAFSWFDIYLFFLKITLNIGALAMVLDRVFFVGYLVSGILSSGVFYFFQSGINDAISKEQSLRFQFHSKLLKAWDNIFLKNSVVNQKYSDLLRSQFSETKAAIGLSAMKSEGFVFLLSLVSSMPIFTILLILVFKHQNEPQFLAALIITIPKQLEILVNFRYLFQQITNLKTFIERLKVLWKNAQLPTSDLAGKIRPTLVQMNHEPIGSVERGLSEIKVLQKGRKTVTGSNGAGKSSFLLYLHQHLANSFYLPSSASLEIGEELGAESTGERMLKYLQFLKQQNVPVLLLDEWDANLDLENKNQISAQLDELSKSVLIVEVRHRMA